MDIGTSFQVIDSTNKTWKFENLRELKNFIEHEKDFWQEKRKLLPSNDRNIHVFINSSSYLNNILTNIKNIEDQEERLNENQLSQKIHILQNQDLNNLRTTWIWSCHEYVNAYVECHVKYGSVGAEAFYNFIVKNQISHNNNIQNFSGKMLAYEFLHQNSDLVKRRNSEKISLGHLRNNLNEQTTTLITEVDNFKKDFSNWEVDTKQSWNQWIDHSQNEHSKQKETNHQEFENYMEACKDKITELESTYQEKLRLKMPAEYWRKSAQKFQRQAVLWTLSLIASILLGISYFYEFFNSWLTGQEMGVKLDSLQGVVIYASVLTVYIFLIKTLSKLTFSTFHLMRDAEEREQLTYLYLSLINENSIDDSSRDIILQALFSRSETGLLTSESGPTMPGVTELLKTAMKN